jgi:hypothetical protein
MRIRIAFVVMVAAVAAMFFNLVRPATTAPATVQSDDLVLEAGALALWENDGGVVTPRALDPGAGSARRALHLRAPGCAAAVQRRRRALGPLPAEDAETVVALYLRSAPAGGEWSEWQEVEPSGDLTLARR